MNEMESAADVLREMQREQDIKEGQKCLNRPPQVQVRDCLRGGNQLAEEFLDNFRRHLLKTALNRAAKVVPWGGGTFTLTVATTEKENSPEAGSREFGVDVTLTPKEESGE